MGKISQQPAIVWANLTDYSSTVSGLVRTHQIDLTSVAAGEARQGAKANLGLVRWQRYLVIVAIEFVSLAASDETVTIYWAGSPSATAGNANSGGTSGADADYTGTAGDSLADSVKQLTSIGSLTTTADNTTVVQYGDVGTLSGDSIQQYGMPVVLFSTAGAAVADAVEMYVALVPIHNQ